MSGLGGTVPAGGLIAVTLTGSPAAASLAQTLIIIGAATASLPLAKVVLLHGRRIALTFGLAISALGALIILSGSILQNVFIVYFGCAVFGVVSTAIYQGRYTATDLAPEDHRARALSWVVWAGTIGAVLGPNLLYISDALGESFGLPDMGGPYVVAAIAIAIGAIIIYTRLKPDPYLIATTKRNGSQQAPSRHKLSDAVAQLKDKPRAILGIASLAIAMAVLVMLTVTVPARMLDSGISLQIIGLIVSINIAGMYLLSPVVGWLVDYFGRVPMITVGVMISAFACILSGLTSAEATTVLALGQFLLGLGWSCTMISGATLLTDEVSPINRPAVQGFSDLLVNISSAVGGITAGLLILTASFEILCAVALVPLIGITVVISIPACRRHSVSSSL